MKSLVPPSPAMNHLQMMPVPASAGTKLNLFAKKTRGSSASDCMGGRLSSVSTAVEF